MKPLHLDLHRDICVGEQVLLLIPHTAFVENSFSFVHCQSGFDVRGAELILALKTILYEHD